MDTNVQDKLNNFFSRFKKHTYNSKEILVRADDEPAGVFYLVDGIVKMYAISCAGEEVVINTFKPISFFPMAWVLNDSISHYYFEALTPVTVWKAPKDEFIKFIKKEPEVLFDLIRRIYKGLEGYFSRMEYLMSGSATTRLITEILIFAKRFGRKKNGKVTVAVKLTEKDLAAQTGIARETVSRELTKLKDKGLISFQNNTLTVYDLELLESELNID